VSGDGQIIAWMLLPGSWMDPAKFFKVLCVKIGRGISVPSLPVGRRVHPFGGDQRVII